MYFCKIVTNTKIKRTRNHSNRRFNTWIWNEQRAKDGLFITCICHITAARSHDFSGAWHLRNKMPCISYWYVISRVLISSLVILPSFIFANSKCKYEKRVLKLSIRAFSASFPFSKSLNFVKFLHKLEQAKGIQTNPVIRTLNSPLHSRF